MTPSAAPPGTQLVVIADPACSSCEEAATELRDRAPSLGVAPLIVSNGSARDTAAFAQRLGVDKLTFRLSDSLAPAVRTKFAKAPQVLLVSRGVVTSVCASVGECAARAQTPR